jgi:cytosine/adenosine deaminase-related metal-dependent hydrolase
LEGIPNFESVSSPSRKDLSPSSDWHLADAERVRSELLDSDEARITMGITTRDLELLPFEETHRDIGFGRKLGAKRITMHAGVGALSQGARWIEALREADLLGPDLLFSHGQSFTDTELDLIAEACSSISISPESEIGQGADPVTWRALEHAVQISLGADSVGSVSGNLFRQMQFALKLGRGSRARKLDEQGIAPSEVLLPTRTILEVATMGGARAAGLDDMVGSLTPGKRADIVLLRTDRVGMMSGAEPEHIVVLQANAGDVDSVFVDGKVAKRNGKLIGVDLSVLSAKLQASRDYITAAFADSDQSTIREAAKLVLPGV